MDSKPLRASEIVMPEIFFFVVGIIYLVLTKNFLKNHYFIPPDTRSYVSVSESKKF